MLIFGSIATIGYLCFLNQTQQIITVSFHATGPYHGLFVLGACSSALISYPLQILCAFEIIEQTAFFRTGNHRIRSVLVRCLIIVAVAMVALIIPNFTDFLNIVGAIGGSLICLMLPPLLYNL